MNKYILILSIITWSNFMYGQSFQVRTVESDYGYVEVQIREISGTNTPSTSNDITDLQFEIRWPQSYGSDVDVDIICAEYNLVEGLGARQTQGSNYWRVFATDQVPINPDHDWVVNQWESIGIFKVIVTSSSGSGTFELSPDLWVFQGLNFGLDGEDYSPLVYTNITGHPFPTHVYNYVWEGGASPSNGFDENSWTSGANWTDPCGAIITELNPPASSSNCIIPTGMTFWPTNFYNTTGATCNTIWIRPAALVEVPNTITLTTLGDFKIEGGTLDIKMGGSLITN